MTDVVGLENPGTTASEFNMLAFVFDMLLAGINTVKLVKVISCTNSGGVSKVGTVVVQPMVNQYNPNPGGASVPHDKLYAVPYMRVQGGANAIIMDPQPGDIGACGFCDRDSSNVKATGQISDPGSPSMMDWADGLYFGGFLNGVPSQYFAFSATGIAAVTPGKFSVQAASVDIETTGTVTINGATVSPEGEITDKAGVVVGTHEHLPGAMTAGGSPVTGNSGAPVT